MKLKFMLCENKNYKEFLKELSSKRHSFIFQLKFDGIRALVLKDNGNITILNRNNIDYTNKFPELLPSLKKLPDNSIFDGEIIVKNSKGFSDFNKIQMRTHNENPYKIKVLANLSPFSKSLTEYPLNPQQNSSPHKVTKFRFIFSNMSI